MIANPHKQNGVDLEIHNNNNINNTNNACKTNQASYANGTSSLTDTEGLKVAYKQRSNVSFCDEDPVQRQVQQHQLNIHRQNSLRFSNYKKKNDLETKINRMYSFLLVKYHWAFVLLTVFICLVLTGVGFVKQPLPSFLDPKRGFGARGEGTLTSQLIVLKNINKELIKYQDYILDLYEKVKQRNKPDFDLTQSDADKSGDFDDPSKNPPDDYEYDNYDSSNGKDLKNGKDDDYYSDDYKYNEQLNEVKTKKKSRMKRNLDADHEKPSPPSDLLEYDTRFLKDRLFKHLTGNDIIKMMPLNLSLPMAATMKLGNNSSEGPFIQKKFNFEPIESCDIRLGLNMNLEFYFRASDEKESYASEAQEHYNRNLTLTGRSLNKYFNDINSEYSVHLDQFFNHEDESFDVDTMNLRKEAYILDMERNLLNLKSLKSLCEWDKKFLNLIDLKKQHQTPCFFSLPTAVALINNKTDCMELTSKDVQNFVKICTECYDLQQAGVLFWAAEDSKVKSEMDNLLTKNSPVSRFMQLPFINENICFKNNLMHIVFDYLVDKQFLGVDKFKKAAATGDDRTYTVRTSSMLVLNTRRRSGTNSSAARSNSVYSSKFIFDMYINTLNKKVFDDEETELYGLNLMGIREEAAMRLITREMILVALAILLIVAATLLYLKSVVISMILNISVGLAIGVSFFLYRIVFDIELFPFLNMMAAFLLLGIACDDVFVLFDSWYSEKAKIIMEDLPEMIEKQYSASSAIDHTIHSVNGSQIVSTKPVEEYLLPPMFIERKFITTYNDDHANKKPLHPPATTTAAQQESSETQEFLKSNRTLSLRKNSGINIELEEAGITIEKLNDYMLNPGYVRVAILNDEQMIRVMGGTLRHAASSIFVTSFTTAAAFLSNYITKIPCMQLFGVFTGVCIIVYFILVITMLAAFVVLYEKHIQLWRCKLKPGFTNSWEKLFNRFMDKISLMNYMAISRSLPKFLIRFRFVWFIMGLSLGACGMVAVFYYPKLTPPVNWKYQFFQDGNLFENFEFHVKDQFSAYVNEEKRNLTNPEIFYIFGIKGRDTGKIFNPDDDGHIEYDTDFDFIDPVSQSWLNKFINQSIASRPDLFMGSDLVKEWNDYLLRIQLLCSDTLGLEGMAVYKPTVPYAREALSKCRDDIGGFLQSSSVRNFESMMASFPRRIIFISKGSDVTGVLLRVNANRTFASYEIVKEYYDSVRAFNTEEFKTAPKGFDSGWFISIGFALYDLQYQLISGTYSSLVFSMVIALIILLLTSGNVIVSVLAIMTISLSIANTIAIFVFLGWKLDVLESVVIIMSVGLSVDFVCHYGVAYINGDVRGLLDTTLNSIFEPNTNKTHDNNRTTCHHKSHHQTETNNPEPLQIPTENNNNSSHLCKTSSTSLKSTSKITSFFKRCHATYRQHDKERYIRIEDTFDRVGSAVLMAALTTFLAGASMFPSGLTSFSKMGQFLMLVMCTSYLYATFFFVPMLSIFGPTKNFGKLNLKKMFQRLFNKCVCCCGAEKKSSECDQLKSKFTGSTPE